MKLNRLELIGFKSFPKKTVFEFDSGIVGIIGPNGCGKTNILEAIKWVLGEQNPYKMRGEKMEDFVFNGSHSYKPLNFAEVTAVIENDGKLPISYQEIAITRRFYRSGESEYLINKVNVRLKDIVSLFLNTGLKAEAYSIFSRDMIDNILSASSKAKRVLFEEASETAMYKNRKKSALDNLVSTEGDIVRVNDILEEVEKQWRMLKRQVRRAKKYQKLKEELQNKRILLVWQENINLLKELSQVNERLMSLEAERKKLLSSLESIEKSLHEKQNSVKKEDDIISSLREKINEITEERNKISEQIIVTEERAKNILLQKENLENENEVLKKKIPQKLQMQEEAKENMENILSEIEKNEKENSQLKQSMSSIEEKFVLKREEYENILKEKEDMKEEIKELKEKQISKIAESKNREEIETSYLSELDELKSDDLKLKKEIDEIKKNISHLNDEEKKIKAELDKKRTGFNRLKEKREAKEQEIKELEGKATVLKNEANFLKNFAKRKEGYNELIRTLNRKFSLLILPEILEISAERKESLLGVIENFIQTVILTEPKKLKEIKNIVEKKGMRAGIFLTFLDGPELKSPKDKGIIGSLSQFLRIKEEGDIKKKMLSFFSRYLIVDSIETAIKLQEKYSNYIFVTEDGNVLSDFILFTGKGTHRGLMGLDGRIKKNNELMRDTEAGIKEKERERESIEKEEAETEIKIDKLNTEFLTIITRLREKEFNCEKKIFEKNAGGKRIEKVNSEMKQIEGNLTKLKDSIIVKERFFREETNRFNSLEKTYEEKQFSFKKLEKELYALREKVNKSEISLTRLKGEAKAKEEILLSQKEILENINSQERDNIKKIMSFEKTIVNLKDNEKILGEKLDGINKELNRVKDSLNKQIETEKDYEQGIEELEQERNDVTEKEKELYEEISRYNLERVKRETSRESLRKKIKEEYSIELDDIDKDKPFQPRERLQEELDILEERKRKFGPVNPIAEQDLMVTQKRKDDLIEQRTDLQEAQNDLRKTIEYVDSVAREKFLATFNEVRKNFKGLFSKLFGTGECDILLDEDDPLEAGITIVAKPKNKKMTRIELLSTGERALIAISLLFSFYLVKPSPICVLDEVDAPLDDANVEKFLALLQEFKKRSQLFIITHNKRTMEASDYLYGITMSEPGVSTIASVKIS